MHIDTSPRAQMPAGNPLQAFGGLWESFGFMVSAVFVCIPDSPYGQVAARVRFPDKSPRLTSLQHQPLEIAAFRDSQSDRMVGALAQPLQDTRVTMGVDGGVGDDFLKQFHFHQA